MEEVKSKRLESTSIWDLRLQQKTSFTKHLSTFASKAQVAANAAWGVLKRANIGSLKRRGYLMNTLVQTIFMYGAEI